MRIFCTLLICIVLFHNPGDAQTCTTPGQNPSTAFPVCGTSTFKQNTVPLCGGRSLPSPACSGQGAALRDINPFWYKFTCFKAGTLGFVITPNNLGSDYDWELYDITGRNANDLYTDGGLVVSSNWSGESGVTGASSSGNQLLVCAGFGKPLFSSMATLQVNHNYLLLISHFTASQSGYSLAFGGGTAVITDSIQPKLSRVEANCGGDLLKLKLNKKIKCSSISTNGSEFTISPAVGTISSATGIGCTTQFDTDSLHLQLPQFLPPGSFTLRIKNGDDNNTLLDYCDNTIDATEELKFTVLPKAPTPFDSLAPVKCAPNKLVVVFAKPVLCSSIATNGSDFSINGSYPTSIASATPNCTGTTTREVVVTLSNTLQQAGTFTLTLAKGSDGNAVVDECGEETPAGRSISFSVKDTVDASFTYKIGYGCTKDTVQYFHAAGNGVNSWKWSLDESQSSQQQNATSLYSVFNEKTIQLIVNNGFCTDTSTQKVKLANFLKADFTTYNDNCPNEPVPFTSTAVGKVTVHSWAFGDGGTANTASPTHSYAPPTRETAFTVRYTVTDSFGCQSTMQKKTNIYTSCYLAVPSAFTPNGDGLNDFFHPLNAIKAEQLTFAIFNRWGELIFKTGDWKQGWNGRQNDKPLGSGSYVWLLSYVDRDTRKRVEQKGTVVLIR